MPDIKMPNGQTYSYGSFDSITSSVGEIWAYAYAELLAAKKQPRCSGAISMYQTAVNMAQDGLLSKGLAFSPVLVGNVKATIKSARSLCGPNTAGVAPSVTPSQGSTIASTGTKTGSAPTSVLITPKKKEGTWLWLLAVGAGAYLLLG